MSMTIQGLNVVSIDTKERQVIKNGRVYDIPHWISTNNTKLIDGDVFVGGFELKNGEFKRTFRALWHLFF